MEIWSESKSNLASGIKKEAVENRFFFVSHGKEQASLESQRFQAAKHKDFLHGRA